MLWGFSEAMDFYQEYLDAFKKQLDNESSTKRAAKEDVDKPRNLNILLFGGNDPRHVIKTMAKLYKHKIKPPHTVGNNVEYQTPTINFYVFEGCPEAFARYTALLGIALEHPESIDMGNKVHLFMDVYGNALLRPSSSQYLARKAGILTKMIRNEEVMKKLAPMLDMVRLKERERKGMENAYRFWLPAHVFEIKELWAERIKQALEDEYNFRERIYKWDLMMTLWERNAKRICLQEYCEWRETGIAFQFPNYEQSQPNKTLNVGGDKYLRCDTQTGPFCAFGLKTTDEQMMHSVYFRATDLTAATLTELFFELQYRQPYQHDQIHSCMYKLHQLRKANEWDAPLMDYGIPWIHIKGTRVHFISPQELFAKGSLGEQWKDFFDVVFVGQLCNNLLTPAFDKILKPNALLLVETNMLTLASDHMVTAFAKNHKLFGELKYRSVDTNCAVLKFKKVKGG